jgi:hypothetical protein
MIGVCESTGPLPFLGIGVPIDSPIHSIEQLKGKNIGVSSAGSLTDWLAKELARTQGWGPQGVNAVSIGNGANGIIAAFRQNLIDADVSVTSLLLAMEENQTGRLLFPVTKYEGSMASGTVFASQHLIDTNPDAVRAFIAAWIETVDYMRTHKAETAKIESGITGFSENVMAKDYDLTIGMFTKGCEFDAESIANLSVRSTTRKFCRPRRICPSFTPTRVCRSDGLLGVAAASTAQMRGPLHRFAAADEVTPRHGLLAPSRSPRAPPDRRWWPASARRRRRRFS